jgi:hypothetical protein
VATIKIYDRANEFRIEIVGRFAKEGVAEVSDAWKAAQLGTVTRKFTVDITRLTSYDSAGCTLLRQMYRHGTQFAAGTPLSLVFLNELSAPLRHGPALVQEAPSKRSTDKAETRPHVRAIAAGE